MGQGCVWCWPLTLTVTKSRKGDTKCWRQSFNHGTDPRAEGVMGKAESESLERPGGHCWRCILNTLETPGPRHDGQQQLWSKVGLIVGDKLSLLPMMDRAEEMKLPLEPRRPQSQTSDMELAILLNLGFTSIWCDCALVFFSWSKKVCGYFILFFRSPQLRGLKYSKENTLTEFGFLKWF